MSNIFASLKNVPMGKWEIINVTETTVTLRGVKTDYCPYCGHIIYQGETIRTIPRERYEETRKRMKPFFDLFK